MKVNDSSLDAASTARLGGAAQTEAAAPAGRHRASGENAAAQDTVQLSNLSSRLIGALEAESATRTARLERLAAEVRSGRYRPDALEISRKLIDDALSAES